MHHQGKSTNIAKHLFVSFFTFDPINSSIFKLWNIYCQSLEKMLHIVCISPLCYQNNQNVLAVHGFIQIPLDKTITLYMLTISYI